MKLRSKRDVEKFVTAEGEGRVERIFGPSEINSSEVWEVWVYVEEDGEYYTRFVYNDGVNKAQYFSEFQQFCVFINKTFTTLNGEITRLTSNLPENNAGIHQRKVILYVAALVFIACVATLIALVLMEKAEGSKTIFLLGGLIASGVGLFFGNWTSPGFK
jgi:hypothetical protein